MCRSAATTRGAAVDGTIADVGHESPGSSSGQVVSSLPLPFSRLRQRTFDVSQHGQLTLARVWYASKECRQSMGPFLAKACNGPPSLDASESEESRSLFGTDVEHLASNRSNGGPPAQSGQGADAIEEFGR